MRAERVIAGVRTGTSTYGNALTGDVKFKGLAMQAQYQMPEPVSATRRLAKLAQHQCLHVCRSPRVGSMRAMEASAAEPGGFPGWPDANSKAQPMPEVPSSASVEVASSCYRQCGYLVLRDVVPAAMLTDLQRRFDHHTAEIIRERGKSWRNYGKRFQIDELKDDPAFERLADYMTQHPVVQSVAHDLWNREGVLRTKPYGSLHPAGEASNQSWHNDARLPDREGVQLIPFLIRASVLLDTVTENMGPTTLLPGSHGTRESPPAWAHTAERQPRALPGMQKFTGNAGDVLLNDVSIWHASTPNLSNRPRKLVWLLWGPGLT